VSDVNANIGVNIDSSQALAELKRLQRQISEFNLSIVKSNQAAALAQQALQRNFINNINSIGAFSAELRTVNTTAESFTKALEGNKLSMREYFRYAGASTKTFGQNFKSELNTISKVAEERVKTLQTQYIKMGRDANGAMKAIAVRPLVLDMDSLATKTQLAAQKQALFNQLVKQGSTNLLNFGKNTQWAGRQLMVGFTLPLVAFGAAASKSFQQLETEVIKFRKVYGDLGTNQQETEAALKNIQALADGYTKYGVEVSKTVGLASQAAAAGFKGADLMAQTEAATKLAILGQIDQQQALETTISLQNAFKISSTELAGTIDFLNAVENQTVTSLDDITTAIPKVAPVIQSLGGDVKDLAFFLTAMKEGGINASEGANALKSGLASLINPSNKANAMLSSMGINIDNIVSKNQGNLKATVVEFALALDKLDPLSRARAIETLFGKFQFARISTLLSNVIDQGNQASRVLDLAGQSTANLASLTEKELGITAQSALVKFQAAMAKLKASLAPVGEVFMKAVAPVIEFVSRILDRFNDLSEGTKKFIAITVGVIGGLGPIVLMTFGLLANGVANIIKLFAVLRNGYQRLTGQSSNLGEQTQYLTNEQLEAAAAAHSLEQSHARLTQQFSVEASMVNQLRNAYQQALTAGAAFAKLNPAMMRTPKNFADGGVVVSGPGGPKDDMVPANLSNGEVVLSVDTVNKNRSIVAGLLSNRSISIPGYAADPGSVVGSIAENFIGTRVGRNLSGGEKAQVNIPGGYQLGHFAEPIQMTGAQLRASVANEAQTLRTAVEALITSVGGSLTTIFDVFTNQVTVQSAPFNQLLKDTGSGRTAPVEMFRTEAVDQAGVYNAPLIREMKRAGASTEEVTSAVQQLATEFESGINNLGEVTTVTAEDVNTITQNAYNAVADTRDDVREAQQRLQRLGALKEKVGVTKGRTPYSGGYNTKGVREEINAVVQEQGPGLYPTQQAFNFMGPAARKVGIQNAVAMRQIFDQLDAEAKSRIFRLVGNIDAMSEQVVAEAQRAGIDIGRYAVQGVAQGAETASPSDATRRTAKDIIEGLRMELAAGQRVVAAAGTKVGQTAVQSVDIGVANGVKKRRVSYRPQGPAPIGVEAPAGATFLPIVAADIIARQSNTGTDKGAVAGKKGLVSGKGMVGGMGLMAGSMALSTLPEFTGKAMLQSSMNLASMGAMFGPWGAAAGAAIGLVTSGLSSLIEKEKEQKAMAEAVFKPSAEFADYFGNSVEDVNISIANFSSRIVDLNEKVDTLGKTFGITNEQLSAFQEMVNSLPEDNSLKQLIDGLTDEDNVDKVKELVQAFIATRVALGEIKTDQAQKALDLVLAASGHTDLLGQVFVGFATRTQAVSQNLKNAATDVDTLGNALALLAGTASNAQSLQELQVIIDGIAQSGISASMAISGLFAAFKGAKNQQGQDLVEGLSKIEGIQGDDLVRAYAAVSNGMNLSTTEKTTREELIGLLNEFDNSRKFVSSETKQTTELKNQIKSKEGQIKLLEKQKKLIDDQLKKEKEISDELKKQNEYKQEQSSLDQKIAEAKMSGNYIEATILEQQKRGNTAEFAQDAKVTDLQKQSDALAEKIALIQESNQELANKVSENTAATNSNTAAITNQGSYAFTPSQEVSPREKDIITQSNKPAVNSLIIDPETGKPRTVTGDEGRSPIAPQTRADEKRVFNNDPYWDKNPIFTPQQVWQYFRMFQNKQYQGIYYFEPSGIATKGKGGEYAGRWYGETDVPGFFSAFATGGEVKHFEPGGNVRGPGTGTSDSIPAMLSNGEYVVKASAVSQYGVPLLHAINSQKFNTGGFVQKFGTGGMPKLPTSAGSTATTFSPATGIANDSQFKLDKEEYEGMSAGLGKIFSAPFTASDPKKKSSKYNNVNKGFRDSLKALVSNPLLTAINENFSAYNLFGGEEVADGLTNIVTGNAKWNDYTAAILPFAGTGTGASIKSGAKAGLSSASKVAAQSLSSYEAQMIFGSVLENPLMMKSIIKGVKKSAGGKRVKLVQDPELGFGGSFNDVTKTIELGDRTFVSTAIHEALHNADAFGAKWSYKDFVKYIGEKYSPKVQADFVKTFPEKKKNLYAGIENSLNNPSNYGDYAFFRGLMETHADDKIAQANIGAFNNQLFRGDIYKDGNIYGSSLSNLLDLSQKPGYDFYRDPNFFEGMLYGSPNMPAKSKQRYQDIIDALKKHSVNAGTPENAQSYYALKEYAELNHLAKGGMVQKFKTGGMPSAPHEMGMQWGGGKSNKKSLPKRMMQGAWDNLIFPTALWADRIQSTFTGTNPIASTNLKQYAEWDAKIKKDGFMSATAAAAPTIAMDLAGLIVPGAIQAGLGRTFIEQYGMSKGIPGLGSLLPKGSIPFATSGIKKPIMGALAGAGTILPGIMQSIKSKFNPGSALRKKFETVKAEDKLLTPEGEQARVALAQYEALMAAKINKFTPLMSLRNTTSKQLITENQAMPSVIEEPFILNGKDYVFKFIKHPLSDADAPVIDDFLAEIKTPKFTGLGGEKTVSTPNKAQIIDPLTKQTAAEITYDSITGAIRYRFTEAAYQQQGLSEALYNKAASVSRIRHSAFLTPAGRATSPKIGGFMSQDDIYNLPGLSSLTGSPSLTAYLQKFAQKFTKPTKPKKPKKASDPDDDFDDEDYDIEEWFRNQQGESTIGWQNDRIAEYNTELRANLRPETIAWFANGWRTSRNFPYGNNGYIEPAALPELQRIIALEEAAAARGVVAPIPPVSPTTDPFAAWRNSLIRTYNSYPGIQGSGSYIDPDDLFDMGRLQKKPDNAAGFPWAISQEAYRQLRPFDGGSQIPRGATGGFIDYGRLTVPKFHSWNGPIPGPYGQELSAVLKSGTEGVYQEDYMNRLRRDADVNTSTSNSNTVYNIDMVVNGGGANANEIANQVMMKIKNISDKNNTSNKVAF
jgi:TP901 family phage tail tape measure protein